MRTKVVLATLLIFLALIGGLYFAFFAAVPINALDIAEGKGMLPGALDKKIYDLSGEWEFVPGELLEPSDFSRAAGIRSITLPGSWRDLNRDDAPGLPAIGTYRLRIGGLRGLSFAALGLPPLRSAGRIWINGTELETPALPARSKELEIPLSYRMFQVFPVPESGEWEIVIQLSSFHHPVGGIWEGRVLLGDPNYVGRWTEFLSVFNLFLLTVLLVSAVLIFLLASFGRRRDHLYLALFILFAFLRSLVTGQKILPQYFPELGAEIFLWIEYLSLPAAGAALFLFFWNRYQKRLVNWPLYLYTALMAVLMPSLFLLPPGWLPYLFLAELVASALIFAYLWRVLYLQVRKGNSGAGLHLIGTVQLLLFAVNDFLLYFGFIETIYLLPIGLIIFLFTHLLVQFLAVEHEFDKIRNLHDHMRQADRLKDQFLANTSHELRTPIHGIVGLAESMLRGSMGELNEDQSSTLSLVVSSGLRLSAMVNDILDFSKLREGGIRLQLAEVDLYQTAIVVSAMCKPLILGKPVRLINELAPHALFAHGDEARIEQILYNLVSTAIKFTTEGELRLSAEEDEDLILMRVEADGMDLSSETLGKVFTAYETDNLSLIEGYQGTGMGLAITKSLIELHGGEVSFASDEDGLVSFTFSLPRASAVHRQENEENYDLTLDALANLESLHDNNSDIGRYAVLVADDNPVNLQVMKNQLSGDEFRVVAVLTGQEALDQMERIEFDLVLLDIMMPGLDGYEVCRRIREKYSATELPVILVTAKSEVMDMEEGLKAGANDFLAKPYTQEEFLARVRTHLNLAKINSIYSRFVPMEFLDFLGHDNIVDIQLGDQVQKEMTVLFVDIRAFTALSESMTPQENFKFINSFLSRLTPMIQNNGGIIDKYIGDSIMALFPNRPEDAIAAATEMVQHMELYNKQRATCGYRPISIGVGIHTGNLILGIIGDQGRMQGTVISDAVNLASRIQDVTKLYGANIIISQESFIKLENPTAYGFRFLGKVRVKGKNQSVSLFEIFDGDLEEMQGAKNETKTDFESAILHFSKKEFEEAAELFKRIIAANPHDKAARLFLEKAEMFIAQEKRKFLFSG